MNIIILSSSKGKLGGINLAKPLNLMMMMLFVSALMAAAGYLGYHFNDRQGWEADRELVAVWQEDIDAHRQSLERLQEEADADIDALSSRIGVLQAHVMRLDALGRKLVTMAEIDQGEFDFNQSPASVGGPETQSNQMFAPDELSMAIERLNQELSNRENQLTVLENLVLNQNLQNEVQPSGRPILKGWISSYYGMRTHPLSGRREMHKGMDFAGKMGGPVIAVAKGVVTYAGKRWGYGQGVDIAHGNGYTTRYAHNSKILVSVGDKVEKGFQIAEIGSSGRSTGPHVHFEVIKNGVEINPLRFIRAAN